MVPQNENHRRIWGCSEVIEFIGAENVSCCPSCHEDAEQGYPMSWIFEAEMLGGHEAEVCCAVRRAFDKWLESTKAVKSPTPETERPPEYQEER